MSGAINAERARPPGKSILRPVDARPVAGASDDTVDIRHIFGVLRRRAGIIVGFMLLSTILAIVVVSQLTPRYTAEATIMLDPRKNQLLDIQSLLSEMQGDEVAIRSEVEILQSPALAAKVAEKLNLDAVPEFNPRLMTPNRIDSVINSVLHPLSWITQTVSGLTTRPNKAAAPQVESNEEHKTAMGSALLSRVTIINDGRSYLLRIRAEAIDRQFAAKIANTYVDVYLLSQLEAKFEEVRRASTYLNDQLSDLRDKARDSDRAVQIFREQNNLTEVKGGTVMDQQLSELNSQLILAAADRAQKEAGLRQLQDQIRSGRIDAASVMGSPLVQKLREQESDLVRQEAELSTRYKPGHPTMVNIRAQITDVRSKIDEEANKTVRGLTGELNAARAREGSLRDTLEALQKGTAQESKVGVQLRELEREADANKTIYESFLGKFKQTTAEQDIQQADARLVSPATVPTGPSYPNKTMLVGFTLVISSFIGIVVAFLLEHLDNGFRTSEQIEAVVGLSTLGLVPAIFRKEPPQDVVVKHPTSQYSEAIRTIRTALRFSDIDHPPKIVLVTSSLPSEGKTVFAVSLARSVARSGGKALLIDCDLRRPSIAKLLGVAPEPGLLDMFSEGGSPDSIISADKESGLFYIPSKSGTPNPQDLLGSQQMRSFLERMRSRFDLIVLDAPPVLAVSDAIVLSHSADTTLYLVRWEKTARPIMTGALKLLQANGGHIAGVVLTRVNARRHASYGYGDAAYHYGRYSEYYATKN